MPDSMNPRKIYDLLKSGKAAEKRAKDAVTEKEEKGEVAGMKHAQAPAVKQDERAGETNTPGDIEATMEDLFKQIPGDCLILENGLKDCMLATFRSDLKKYFRSRYIFQ
ncbi:hypothetical protein RF11_05304 [Thelohanellus kitauei]|uniref:Uncharacterized protein n=1 Tax=Thelohanellus kitauei TaxID=669202 RepID=A0A0C2MP35_THEKT|nr:hypothetical protein RF11_05304 [Thelohanellus kitauei]